MVAYFNVEEYKIYRTNYGLNKYLFMENISKKKNERKVKDERKLSI